MCLNYREVRTNGHLDGIKLFQTSVKRAGSFLRPLMVNIWQRKFFSKSVPAGCALCDFGFPRENFCDSAPIFRSFRTLLENLDRGKSSSHFRPALKNTSEGPLSHSRAFDGRDKLR